MPFSTGSTDSGYFGLRHNEGDVSTTSSDLGVTGTDEDEVEPTVWKRPPPPQRSNRTKTRKRSRKNHRVSDVRSLGSSGSSEIFAWDDEERRATIMSLEEIVLKVYVYFQSLLVSYRRQQKLCEHMSSLIRDYDGRWGAPLRHHRSNHINPRGCLAPLGFGDPSKSATFPGYWAVPHPSVLLALSAKDVTDYMQFLKSLFPGVVEGLTAPAPGSSRSSSCGGHEDGSSATAYRFQRGNQTDEEMLQLYMQIVQQNSFTQQQQQQHVEQQFRSRRTNAAAVDGGSSSASSRNAESNPKNVCHQSSSKEKLEGSGSYQKTSGSVSTNGTKIREGYAAVVARAYQSNKSPPLRRQESKNEVGNESSSSPVGGPSSESSVSCTQTPTANATPTSAAVAADETPVKEEQKAVLVDSTNEEVKKLVPDVVDQVVPEADKTRQMVSTGTTRRSSSIKSRSDNRKGTTCSVVDRSDVDGSRAKIVDQDIERGSAVTKAERVNIIKAPCPPPAAPLGPGGQFEVSKMDVLSEEIWHYHNKVAQTESMLSRKLHLRDMLYYTILPVFPMCGLYVVGSSLNGFGNNSSDMDLCLMITNKDLDQKTDAVVVLNMILSTLEPIEFVAQQQLIPAKVPILRIKFHAPFSDITVDLNANNSVAIKNTHLLCYYSSFDWRVRPLVSVVKEWAKRKGINDANRSSFTSYSLVLMVIHYLQCGVSPAVLPSLQSMFSKRFNNKCDVRTLNVTQPLGDPPEDWRFNDSSSVGELLLGFFDYYARAFDFDTDAISVRLGRRVERAVITKQKPPSQNHHNPQWRHQWRCICIEEPFTLSNTAHSVYDEMVFVAIKEAFKGAYVELEATRDLQALLETKPINPLHNLNMHPMYSSTVAGPGAVVYSSPVEHMRVSTPGETGTRSTSTSSSASPPLGSRNMVSGSAQSLSTAHSSASSSNGDELEIDQNKMSGDTRIPLVRRTSRRRREGAAPLAAACQ